MQLNTDEDVWDALEGRSIRIVREGDKEKESPNMNNIMKKLLG